MFEAIQVDGVPRLEIGPGCYRQDLPSPAGLRIWVVEIARGAQWPHVDRHGAGGEQFYVLSGEIIEGERRFAQGTFVHFHPYSEHQPSSEHGARLLGINLQ